MENANLLLDTSSENCMKLLLNIEFNFLNIGSSALVFIDSTNSFVIKIPYYPLKAIDPKSKSIRKKKIFSIFKNFFNKRLSNPTVLLGKIFLKDIYFTLYKNRNYINQNNLNKYFRGYKLGERFLPNKPIASKVIKLPVDNLSLNYPENKFFEIMKSYFLPYILKTSSGFVIQKKFQEKFLLKKHINKQISSGQLDKIRSLFERVLLYQENAFLVNSFFDLDLNIVENYIINDNEEVDIVDLGYLTDDMDRVQFFMYQNLSLAKKILDHLKNNKKVEEHKIEFSSLGGQIIKYFKIYPEMEARQLSIIFLEAIITSRTRSLDKLAGKRSLSSPFPAIVSGNIEGPCRAQTVFI